MKFLAACLFLLTSCGSISNESIYKLVEQYPAKEFNFTLSTGETRRAYEFYSNGSKGEDGIVVMVLGSGCSSADSFRVRNQNAVGRYKYITLEKAGVKSKATFNDKCEPEFYAKHSHDSYAKDIAEFANAQFKKHGSFKNKILFGGSEGGAIAALSAPSIKNLTHLVIVGTGGGTGEDFMYELGKVHSIPRILIDKKIEEIKNNPNNHEVAQGDFSVGSAKQSFGRYHLKGLEQIKISVLIAHGGKDTFAPFALAAKACDELQKTKNNVSYYFEAEGEHILKTPDQQNTNKRLYENIDNWVKGLDNPRLYKQCPFK